MELLVHNHPFTSGLLAQTVTTLGYKRHNFCHSMAGIKYNPASLPLPLTTNAKQKFGIPDRPYITIADGYDYSFHANKSGTASSTKSYPHFDSLIREIKREHPGSFIVQIGKDVGKPMLGADLVLLNKTSLSEMAEILRSSSLHIDNEGGLVHLANCLDVRSCVIFGPTSLEYFGYEENLNVAPIFCGNCYWVNPTWMVECPRGYNSPRCLTDQPPGLVAAQLAPTLREIFSQHSSHRPVERMSR